MDSPEKIAAGYMEELTQGVFNQRGGRTNHSAVLKLLHGHEHRSRRVLDLGCGDGAVAQSLHDAGWHWESYTGIDCTSELLAIFAGRNLPRCALSHGNATELARISDGSIDVIMCLFMLQHLPEDEGTAFVEQMARILSPQGAVLIGAPVVPKGESITFIGERGYGTAKTRRWNWGELAVIQKLARSGLKEVTRHVDPNPNGLAELYLLLTATGRVAGSHGNTLQNEFDGAS